MFNFGLTKLPKNKKLRQDIKKSADSLFKKLIDLNLKEQEISDYTKTYFGDLIGNKYSLESNIRKYASIIAWATDSFYPNLEKVTLIDYGAGHGMLSMMAKEFGIGTVIVSDIFQTSVQDAQTNSSAIGLEAEHYISGDTAETLKYLKENSLNCDIVANYDVIEHIYDIHYFLRELKNFGSSVHFYLASGANGLNPFINKKLVKGHRYFEFTNRNKKFGHKERDNLKAYLEIRKDIITKNFPELDSEKNDRIAKLTRGMIQKDIIESTKDYLTGKDIVEIDHPTNTCDPMTGNWAEHIMNPYELQKFLKQDCHYKSVHVDFGYYGTPRKLVKRIVGNILNLFMSLLPDSLAIRLSPYYSLKGKVI